MIFITFFLAIFIGITNKNSTPKAIKDNCHEFQSRTANKPNEDQNFDKKSFTFVIRPVVAESASLQNLNRTIPEVFLSKKADSLTNSFLYKANFKSVEILEPT